MAHIFHFHEPPHQADQITQLAAKQSGQPRARRLRVTIFALIGILLWLILLVEFARAGGPQYVAGIRYFKVGLAGQPLTWPLGSVNYYTDQGDLSESGFSAENCSADAREGTAKSSEESKDCRDNQKSCPCK
jgi:hypothetical protein